MDRTGHLGDHGAPQGAPPGPEAPASSWIGERTRVAVGRNINVSGRLIFHEPVRIEGRFRGEVSSAALVVISEEGTIEGKVRAPRLVINGELRGDVVESKLVVLGPRARVHGNIEAEKFAINEGAHFYGHVQMTNRAK